MILRAAAVLLGVIAVLFLCWAVPCVATACLVDLDKPCRKHSPFFRFYANSIIGVILWALRIRLHVTGMELLPKEKFLLVSNHRSALDPIIQMGVLRKYRIGFVAKKELFKIPVIGKIMHKCFCLALDRDNLRAGARMMVQAAGHIQSQTAAIGIYPEGTRGHGNELLPFKNGVFKIAQRAGCPIVIAVIRNSESVTKNAPLRRTDVYLDIVGVLSAEDIGNRILQRLSGLLPTAGYPASPPTSYTLLRLKSATTRTMSA